MTGEMAFPAGRIALVGANGMLAQAVRRLIPADAVTVFFDLPDFDLTNREQVLSGLEEFGPELVLNCAAMTDVDGCESQEELAMRINGLGPGYLAEAALGCGARLVHVSTDYVFDGSKSEPWLEDDPTGPLSVYGRGKLAGELAIRDSGLEDWLIVRTSWLYGSGGKNFVETMLWLMSERRQLRVVDDQVGSPTYTRDLAEAMARLVTCGVRGVFHFANSGQCSWHGFACAIAEEARSCGMALAIENIEPITTADYPLPAQRPAWSVLSTRKYQQETGACPPDWRSALRHYLKHGRGVLL